jgi:hypothetical protein
MNDFLVTIVSPTGAIEHCHTYAESSSDAMSMVMDLYPDAKRISVQLASVMRTGGSGKSSRRTCEELGVCQGDLRCEGCTQRGRFIGLRLVERAPAPSAAKPGSAYRGFRAFLRGLARRERAQP